MVKISEGVLKTRFSKQQLQTKQTRLGGGHGGARGDTVAKDPWRHDGRR